MNRRHGAQDYIRLVEKIRLARPDLALSSDFIVGFPGETDADFTATLDLISEVRFASCFTFKYSPRPGTPGAELDDQVDESVKTERLHRLQALVELHRQQFNASLVGQITPVLFEKAGRHDGQVAGKSPYLQPVQIDGSLELIGQQIPVEILRCGSNSLFGRRVETGSEGAA
jgi:tRNA-2-methylthio-N6-dimethylallyladenosine synthase